ncbi:uncharacterized protein LOC122398969 [Colletes gigas]|uniref:uncharacterized protein LOC122398969 n=1 Tax=Colletes gigas TaxID=935657 RepID=UPI001C9B88BA|nr:uncharacterized protein LOC122398969 [Colletes gigas]
MKIRCPFDTLHMIDKIYFEAHISNCASSSKMRKCQYSYTQQHRPGTVTLETVKYLSAPVMKNWSKEHVETYDPWKSTETRNVVRCIVGSRLIKKQFKYAERKRIQALCRQDKISRNLRKCFKRNTMKKCINISQLVQNMKRLYVEDFDSLLNSIDISKLYISDVNSSLDKRRCAPVDSEKILVKKLKELMLCRLRT